MKRLLIVKVILLVVLIIAAYIMHGIADKAAIQSPKVEKVYVNPNTPAEDSTVAAILKLSENF